MSDGLQKKIFSKNLNELMFLNSKTQSEVARAIRVSPQTFNTWMQGIAIPRMDKIQLLADYFHVKKSSLIEERSSESKAEKNRFNETQMSFAKNLNKLLSSNNKTQLELANYIGVSNTSVNNWTKGYNTPRMDKIDLICSFFHIDRKDLFTSNQSEQNLLTNSNVLRVAQELSTNSKLMELFNIAIESTPKQLSLAVDMLKQFKKINQ